jgi:hypothetical protein
MEGIEYGPQELEGVARAVGRRTSAIELVAGVKATKNKPSNICLLPRVTLWSRRSEIVKWWSQLRPKSFLPQRAAVTKGAQTELSGSRWTGVWDAKNAETLIRKE